MPLTLDQFITQLQNLSWQGKGNYHVVAENYRERFFNSDQVSYEIYEGAKVINLVPRGPYVQWMKVYASSYTMPSSPSKPIN